MLARLFLSHHPAVKYDATIKLVKMREVAQVLADFFGLMLSMPFKKYYAKKHNML